MSLHIDNSQMKPCCSEKVCSIAILLRTGFHSGLPCVCFCSIYPAWRHSLKQYSFTSYWCRARLLETQKEKARRSHGKKRSQEPPTAVRLLVHISQSAITMSRRAPASGAGKAASAFKIVLLGGLAYRTILVYSKLRLVTICAGESAVGKSSIVLRFVRST